MRTNTIDNPTNCVVKETEISLEMCYLDKNIEEMNQMLKSFEDRISAILLGPSPECPEGKKDEGTRTAFGERLKTYNIRLNNCIENLKELRDRVQL